VDNILVLGGDFGALRPHVVVVRLGSIERVPALEEVLPFETHDDVARRRPIPSDGGGGC
jgi:hypothetical protein